MQNSQIAERIKLLCKSNKIPIKNLLEKCDINRNFIYDLEKRKYSPSVDKLVKIADYFNCSVDYLLGREAIEEDKDLNPYLAEEMAIQRRLNKRLEEYRARQANDNVSNS